MVLKLNSSHTTTLDTFQALTLSDLKFLLQKILNSTAPNDVIPTRLRQIVLTNSPDYFIAWINFTMQTGYYPNQFKQVVVRPLIKKTNLDPEMFSSDRPVTNLRFMSKFVVEFFLSKLFCIWNPIISVVSIRLLFVARIQRKRFYWKSLMIFCVIWTSRVPWCILD